MLLNKTTDHRSPLAKLSRSELGYLARLEDRSDIDPAMPADLIRKRFAAIPPKRIPRPMAAAIGTMKRLVIPKYEDWVRIAFEPEKPPEPETVVEVDAMDDLERQWAANTFVQPPDYDAMQIWELKSLCKKRGIKSSNTWKKQDCIDALEAIDP